ncbi:MAG: Crp/Fnr family transcriptional regulator [Bacteroidetes bacterium]|nr:Crp/Fnr family transcriptional regulator [Bacteroidota bacterium]
MINHLIEKIKEDKANWERFQKIFNEKEIPSKTILLQEGDVAKHLHFVKKGCLRMWFNKDGKDITTQFFFEGQVVASIESFMTKQPSIFTLESIEPSAIVSISSEDFEQVLETYSELKEGFQQMLFQRFRNYSQLFLSRIKDTPKERYENLVKNHPEIIQRIPQHYIASYLGITPISLSRIRNRK